jgi:nicotinate-nucleotide pyrophosphorylase (carboxylating)
MDWNNRRVTSLLQNALLEDRANYDATTHACIDANQMARATLIAKQDCILAGLDAVPKIFEVFAQLEGVKISVRPEISIHQRMFDGVRLTKGQEVAFIRHNARAVLSCERVMLNVIQRLSGIATATRRYVDAIAGTRARILDTRKTVPGMRLLDKYAVTCGGGHNHRLDLSDGVLIKNNHIALAGGIVPALTAAVKNRTGHQPIEVEVRTSEELEQAIEHGAGSILLDNMTPEQVRKCVERVGRESRKIALEASGGITLENIRGYAEAGVDFISVGALTHSVQAVDMSLRIQPA